jgi:Zinc knuckle
MVTSTVKGKERAVDKGQTKGKPFVARTNPPNRDGVLNKDALSSQLKCFRCGQQGHKANDPRYNPDVTTTKTKAAQIYAAREIVDDDDQDDGHDDQEETTEERKRNRMTVPNTPPMEKKWCSIGSKATVPVMRNNRQ